MIVVKIIDKTHEADINIKNEPFCLFGQMLLSYNNSAAESGVDFYKIGSDGFTPELVDSFSSVWHLEGEEPVCTYFQKGNEITEEEYKTNMQSCEVTLAAGLDWREIY